MTEMAKCKENEFGCGLIGGIFQRRGNWLRKASSLPALPTSRHSKNLEFTGKSDSKESHNQDDPSTGQRRSSFDSAKLQQPRVGKKPALGHPRISNSNSYQRIQGRRSSDVSRSSTSSSSSSGKVKSSQAKDIGDERKSSKMMMVSDHKQPAETKALVLASSGNILPLGQLGNLRQNLPAIKTKIHLGKSLQETSSTPKSGTPIGKLRCNGVIGNILRYPSDEIRKLQCPNYTNVLDSESLKSMGNEAYKKGRMEEALQLYDRAISLESTNATYRNNKSAALIGLGRLAEAVLESKEAIRIDTTYYRAHNRLAGLYLRLGEVEKALYHFKNSDLADDSNEFAQAHCIKKSLIKCAEARDLQEWNTLLKECNATISAGVHSAPQVFAMQAEALLKLHKHQEAYETYQKGPNFEPEFCKELFGQGRSGYLLMVGAQVHLAIGRFEEAMNMASHAAQLDPVNKEVVKLAKKAKMVASARLSGNLLFNASKYSEACSVYSEGLEYDSHNSILLCNRAACRSKLGQYEKAIEDCTSALYLRPSYSKARLRRADCNAKLERWEASVQDYELLIQETPGDVEVGRALFEAQVQLKKQRGEEIKHTAFGSNLISISRNESFRELVTSPGMSVVLFHNKSKHKQVLQIMQRVCRRYPSVHFLKVDIEDHPYIAKTESLSSVPAFKIYKNGSKVKEIPGRNHEFLENCVKLYSS